MDYQVKMVYDHVEVYDDQGRFLFSADTQQEALHQLRDLEAA